MDPSIPFVIAMGIGVVFIGLICIILLSTAMSAICRAMGDKTPAPAAPAPAAPAAQTEAIPNRQAMIAAIAVAVAEEMGTDPAGIRILSIKKL
ncbi:MAG: hypothetical protein HDT18_11160 [Oscillibacter sp.]|nr:hypothetical protein [Oscillibacter sp.]